MDDQKIYDYLIKEINYCLWRSNEFISDDKTTEAIMFQSRASAFDQIKRKIDKEEFN